MLASISTRLLQTLVISCYEMAALLSPSLAPVRRWAPQQQPFSGLRPQLRACRGQACRTQGGAEPHQDSESGPDASTGRRQALLLAAGVVASVAAVDDAQAISANPLGFKKELNKRRRKVPESEYKDGPQGLKYYDIVVGDGATAQVGQRVAIHYEVKWRNVTFMTSRMGMGVTGGNPLGFDMGQPAGSPGSTLPGIDLGTRGMKVGGLRALLVPPSLAYGARGYGEIPGDATLNVVVELLSIKTSPLGYRTKLVEG